MDPTERLKLAMRAEQALRDLRNACERADRDKSEEIGLFVIRMMGWPEHVMGEHAPARLHSLWQVLRGGRPDGKKDDAIQIRALAEAVDGAANMHLHHGQDLALCALRQWLPRIDPAFERMSDAALVEKIVAVHEKRLATSGAVTDLLIESGALDVKPDADRSKLQGRVHRALSFDR